MKRVKKEKQLIKLVANHMKKDYLNWNKEGVEDQKILDDLCEYSDGKIKLTPEDLRLTEQRTFIPRRRANNNGNNNFQQRKNFK